MKRRHFLIVPILPALVQGQTRRQISGVYPHLAMFNSQGECGTGVVMPWAGKLWVLTYSPHMPQGSDDKLYEIDLQLNQVIRRESIGGTPANRMVHRESNQLFAGPYVIGADGSVRAIPYERMFGRPTGNARHLSDPVNKIYLATMEEGFYEVDVKTLAVRQLHEDGNRPVLRKETQDVGGALLPGYHGKGFYSGQGRAVYANNGEVGGGMLPPDTPSGCLAEWDGTNWNVIRRNQFTEVTGPGDVYGNPNPEKDPIWSIGWDHRSLILMLLDNGKWHSYRLPKASHCYDGAHGWNTEWPRIRDIGEKDLLMTMHGMFWRFPKTFSAANSAGIVPRSTYLRVIGDFARWQNRLVFGCDDTAQNEFLNTRRVKGKIAGPGQSQSNLWFVEPARLDQFGVAQGRGAVWLKDDVKAGEPSEPFLFAGFAQRMVHVAHQSAGEIVFRFEVDRAGNGVWTKLWDVKVSGGGYAHLPIAAKDGGTWVRVRTNADCRQATVLFAYAALDKRRPAPVGKAAAPEAGLVWARGQNRGTLLLAGAESLYELDADLRLAPLNDTKLLQWMGENLAPPAGALAVDAASVIYTDEAGKRWRLPKGKPSLDNAVPGVRVSREVSTERDLLHAHGTFYELPSNNAGGIAVVRPVTTHNLPVRDYCSWRGLTVISGLPEMSLPAGEFVRSADGKARLWLGASDDLWQFGKPTGDGGPWSDAAVKAGAPSDPYLMNGYDEKTLRLSHTLPGPLKVRVEVDISGAGLWVVYATLEVPAGKPLTHRFPPGYHAYWVRTVALADATVTAQFSYR